LAILHSLTSDQLEALRVGTIALYILASVAVILGVYWENEDFKKETRKKGWILLLLALGVETLLAIVIFVGDAEIIGHQRAEIIRLTTPRNLSPDAVKRVAEKVCPFGPKQFDIVHVIFDEILFVNELQQVWNKCGWSSQGVENRDAAIAAASEIVGMRVWYDLGHSEEFKGAAEAFASALRDENIAAEAEPIPKDVPLSPNMIHIQHGRRP
jgi:hypothetical protein